MTAPLESSSATDRTDRVIRARLPRLSFIVVLLALLALTIIPILTTGRLEALRSTADSALAGHRPTIRELRDLFSQKIIELQTYRLTGDRETLERYDQDRAREDLLIQRLGVVTQSAGAGGIEFHRRLRELSGRSHELANRWLVGRMTEAELETELPRMIAVRDSLIDLTDAAEREIERQITAVEAAGIRIVITQRSLALSLGALAFIAAVVVVQGGMRERRLTQELAGAVERESRARQIADRRREELQAVSESKARLTRGFSHDVKNPLGAADGYLSLLEEGVPEPVTPAQKGYLEKARRSLAAALNLIEDLLEIERASTGNIRIEKGAVDLCQVVREAVDEYRAQAEAKGLRLELDLSADVPVIVTDRTRVRQVLANLLSNAVKYTPAGAVSVRMVRDVDPERPEAGERIAIEVTDTGIGIPPEKRHLVFQEFTRFEPGVAKGTGIGLAISHRIARALGADLRLESSSASGSRFTLWLPETSTNSGSTGAVGERVV